MLNRLAQLIQRRFLHLLVFLLLLNIADTLFTLEWVHNMGIAEEANPIMAHLIAIDPMLFVVTKLTLVSLACLLLWRIRETTKAAWALVGVTVFYVGIIGIHGFILTHLI